jgi:enediyne biosynthesis protein E4
MYSLLQSRRWSLVLPLAAFALTGCNSDGSARAADLPEVDGKLFTLLPSSATGVRFTNTLTDSRELNVFTYRNYYNGGGAAIGDLNGDGRPEIVLTSNQEGPRLYLNEGNFRFTDVTEASGIVAGEESWTTGVTIADVNGDGRLDVYICRAGPAEPAKRANALWINQGNDADGRPTFKEMGVQYGVADEGFSIHAAFLDYDRDGDLDLFVINNSPRPVSSFGVRNTRKVRNTYGGHHLYRNDGAKFTDVSQEAGIHSSEIGFGLGVAVGDVNRDGWPDIYVSNDFFERDYLFVNRGDGTFDETLDQRAASLTYFSMGLDVADIDNDGWPDVYTTDMLPEDEYRLKTTAMFEGWDIYQTKVRNGYHHQFMRNMLQRNNGDGTFTDVGQMAGVARTDWSWGALIVDLDLDGLKDIFVTNGIARDITSQDYVAFLANQETMKQVTQNGRRAVDFEQLIKAMDSTPIPNYTFHNRGALRFANQSRDWGLDHPGFSSGAAYGDLDGDGALDLVVNNVNSEAFVYRNNTRKLHPDRRSLRISLEGEGSNRFGVGARVRVYAGGMAMMQEMSPARGFQASVDYVLVFGLGSSQQADSVIVEWQDGRVSRLRNVQPTALLAVRQAESAREAAPPARPPARAAYLALEDSAAIPFVHRENEFVDFDRERLLPRMLSTEGPALAVADVNGDGLDDLYIGGAKEQSGRLLIQKRDGSFAASNQSVFDEDAISEDVGAVFFDANGDGRMDLYVVSGGNEFSEGATALQDRLYINLGGGNFRKDANALPVSYTSGSRVAAADYDGDGDVDLFVGARSVPWRYGVNPPNALLQNDGRGRFKDVTSQLAPDLRGAGLVTDAIWHDVDGDNRKDLVIVGDWMPITVLRNTGGGSLAPLAVRGLEKSHGWWNRIIPADVNGDGKIDFIVGNLGHNTRFAASEKEPVTMYVNDFDRNGFVEQVLAVYNEGKNYPLAMREDLIKAVPFLKAKYLNYGKYATQTISDVFSAAELSGSIRKEAFTFSTSLVRNNGDGSFSVIPLPAEAQIAPVYAIAASDVDRDGALDILLAGNFDGVKPEIGRMSEGRGLLLRGDGKGGFTAVRPPESGFVVPGQARDIRSVRTAAGERFVVVRNNERPLLFDRAQLRGGMVAAAKKGSR